MLLNGNALHIPLAAFHGNAASAAEAEDYAGLPLLEVN